MTGNIVLYNSHINSNKNKSLIQTLTQKMAFWKTFKETIHEIRFWGMKLVFCADGALLHGFYLG